MSVQSAIEFQLYQSESGLVGRLWVPVDTKAADLGFEPYRVLSVTRWGTSKAVRFTASPEDFERLAAQYPSHRLENRQRTRKLLDELAYCPEPGDEPYIDPENFGEFGHYALDALHKEPAVAVEPVNLSCWTKAELLRVARQLGLALSPRHTKQQLMLAITG